MLKNVDIGHFNKFAFLNLWQKNNKCFFYACKSCV